MRIYKNTWYWRENSAHHHHSKEQTNGAQHHSTHWQQLLCHVVKAQPQL
jgi:hypothetical protein